MDKKIKELNSLLFNIFELHEKIHPDNLIYIIDYYLHDLNIKDSIKDIIEKLYPKIEKLVNEDFPTRSTVQHRIYRSNIASLLKKYAKFDENFKLVRI